MKRISIVYALCSVLLILPEAKSYLGPEPNPWGDTAPTGARAMTSSVNMDAALRLDTADPMFFEQARDLLTRSTFSIGNRAWVLNQSVSYGINGNLVISGSIGMQNNFDDTRSGFSGVGLLLTHRTSGVHGIHTDMFGGFNFAGSGAIDIPPFADMIYVAGARIGRQWGGFTVAGTIQSNWIFHNTYGMAYIDITPEIYVRIRDGWAAGIGTTWRKSTNPHWDRYWISPRITKRYGRTMYIGTFDYEVERSEWRIGGQINLLF
ncbi:MAG: hypothetical protein FWC83_00060 [Alphaproteobacteria bacterium]|nr:hypothetical protein [Alphaproteobacteria bacterium]